MLLGKPAAEHKRAGSESEDLVGLLISTGPPKRRHRTLAPLNNKELKGHSRPKTDQRGGIRCHHVHSYSSLKTARNVQKCLTMSICNIHFWIHSLHLWKILKAQPWM